MMKLRMQILYNRVSFWFGQETKQLLDVELWKTSNWNSFSPFWSQFSILYC